MPKVKSCFGLSNIHLTDIQNIAFRFEYLYFVSLKLKFCHFLSVERDWYKA